MYRFDAHETVLFVAGEAKTPPESCKGETAHTCTEGLVNSRRAEDVSTRYTRKALVTSILLLLSVILIGAIDAVMHSRGVWISWPLHNPR